MFVVGVLIGFIGAGGAGVTVSLLAIVFGLPIHQAVGTALAAMLFTTASGSISHFREGNVSIAPGVIIGGAGMTGAVIGADLSQNVPEHILQPMAGFALWFLAFLVWLRLRFRSRLREISEDAVAEPLTRPQYAAGAGVGVLGGMASAFFGVGMAPFVQIGMLTVMRQSLIKSVGTTMLALSFISLSGSLALARHGDVSPIHLVGVMIGMTAGSYVGAKFTRRAPPALLRTAIVATPFIGGIPLIFF
jgi:uncharacterized membrane protein YfcA